MNFRFAHYDHDHPPKERKSTPRKAGNAKAPTAKVPTRSTKAQISSKRRTEAAGDLLDDQKPVDETQPERQLDSTETSISHTHTSTAPTKGLANPRLPSTLASERDSSSPSTVASDSSTSSEHAPSSHTGSSVVGSPLSHSELLRLPSLATVLGEGRIDPFHLYPVGHVTPYVQNLIDHGRCACTRLPSTREASLTQPPQP